MVNENKKNAATKLESGLRKDAIANEKDETPLKSLNNMEEIEDDDDEVEYDENDDEDEYEEDEEEEEEEDDDDDDDDDDDEEEEEEEEEEKVNDGGNANAVAVFNNEGTETKEDTVKKDAKKSEEPKSVKKTVEKKDTKKTEEPESVKKSGETSKSKEKRNRKKNEGKDSGDIAVNEDNKPESSSSRKKPKRVASMGMVFMCSTKTKTDCFRYKILGLPESKKDQVLKIYRGMRLFLFDVDLRLMYGIFKAAGPGGYNIEPNAFKSEFPSQVRFTVLDDCLPLAEENFKSVLKENYYSRNKFEGLLKSDQVKNLCKLFVRSSGRSKSGGRSRRARLTEPLRSRPDERRRSRREDRKRRTREEERRPRPRTRSRSPLPREKRRLIEYDREPPVLYDHEPLVMYDREPPFSRYRPPPLGSPVRLYAYERPPLDIPPYIREQVPEPPPYRIIDGDRDLARDRDQDLARDRDRARARDWDLARDRDPYIAYGREPPMYRDAVYTVPPEYHQVSREYHHPPAVQAPEYRVSGGPRVPSYRDVEIASDYRSSAMALPEYRSRTHYNY